MTGSLTTLICMTAWFNLFVGGESTISDCSDEKWRANCSNPDHREFCDQDGSNLNDVIPRSICAPVSAIKFLMDDKDYCGRCRPDQDLVIDFLYPSQVPSEAPVDVVYHTPSSVANILPSHRNSNEPSNFPSDAPSDSTFIAMSPTDKPSGSSLPSDEPSNAPSDIPSGTPSGSFLPSEMPSASPSNIPSGAPSGSMFPSTEPSTIPSGFPSKGPTGSSPPSFYPSILPSTNPTGHPSGSSFPSQRPSNNPSFQPSGFPSGSSLPSNFPSLYPSSYPIGKPSKLPISPTTSLPPFIFGIDMSTKEYNLTFTSKSGILSGSRLQTFETVFRVFSNSFWPYDDSHSVLITDISVLSQTPGLSKEGRSFQRRRQLEDLIHASIKITIAISPKSKDSYDFIEVFDVVFRDNKLVLSNMLQAKGISIVFS